MLIALYFTLLVISIQPLIYYEPYNGQLIYTNKSPLCK